MGGPLSAGQALEDHRAVTLRSARPPIRAWEAGHPTIEDRGRYRP